MFIICEQSTHTHTHTIPLFAAICGVFISSISMASSRCEKVKQKHIYTYLRLRSKKKKWKSIKKNNQRQKQQQQKYSAGSCAIECISLCWFFSFIFIYFLSSLLFSLTLAICIRKERKSDETKAIAMNIPPTIFNLNSFVRKELHE